VALTWDCTCTINTRWGKFFPYYGVRFAFCLISRRLKLKEIELVKAECIWYVIWWTMKFLISHENNNGLFLPFFDKSAWWTPELLRRKLDIQCFNRCFKLTYSLDNLIPYYQYTVSVSFQPPIQSFTKSLIICKTRLVHGTLKHYVLFGRNTKYLKIYNKIVENNSMYVQWK